MALTTRQVSEIAEKARHAGELDEESALVLADSHEELRARVAVLEGAVRRVCGDEFCPTRLWDVLMFALADAKTEEAK